MTDIVSTNDVPEIEPINDRIPSLCIDVLPGVFSSLCKRIGMKLDCVEACKSSNTAGEETVRVAMDFEPVEKKSLYAHPDIEHVSENEIMIPMVGSTGMSPLMRQYQGWIFSGIRQAPSQPEACFFYFRKPKPQPEKSGELPYYFYGTIELGFGNFKDPCIAIERNGKAISDFRDSIGKQIVSVSTGRHKSTEVLLLGLKPVIPDAPPKQFMTIEEQQRCIGLMDELWRLDTDSLAKVLDLFKQFCELRLNRNRRIEQEPPATE